MMFDTPRCHGCGKEIVGPYVEALGQPWHEKHFVCVVCHQNFPDNKFVEHDGKPYCQPDYDSRFGIPCRGCGQAIQGEYIQALGHTWHKEHFVCAVCKQAFANNQFLEKDGSPYCERDYYETFGTRCTICNEPIRGKYFTNGWGEPFCADHKDELKECFSCNRLICSRLTGGGVQYEDGRTVCNLCRKTAIDNISQANLLFGEVQTAMKKHGVSLDPHANIPLRLESLDQIDKLAGGTPAIEAGITLMQVTTLGDRESARMVKEVVILYGLPREHAVQVIAHELGHVWCFLNHIPELPKRDQEGLCELFAYLCLKDRNTPESRYHMQGLADNHDPIYGDGFRRAKEAQGDGSLISLLERVRQSGKL